MSHKPRVHLCRCAGGGVESWISRESECQVRIRQDMAYSLGCYWKSDEYIFVLDQPPSSVPRAGGLADCVYLTARRVSQTSTSSIAHQSACSICRGCPRLVVGYGAVYGAAACLMASTARSALGASWKRRISMHHLHALREAINGKRRGHPEASPQLAHRVQRAHVAHKRRERRDLSLIHI